MSKLSVKAENTNYCARLIRLPSPRAHSNANKLLCVSIMGNNIITGLSAKEGDPYVFFPLETAINTEYLAHSNSLDDPSLNRDKKTKSFFSPKHGRVKALSLRSEKSEGYAAPAHTVEEWSGYKFKEDDFDKDFDHIGDVKLCEKYINTAALRKLQQAERAEKNKNKKVKRESKLVENQFRVAEDTKNLKREMGQINLSDVITISYKLHGCNASIGRVLCKRTLNWYEKILKKIGVKINETHYDLVYASRRIIKNAYADESKQGYYDVDVWKIIADKYQGAIKDNVVLYGEIVGQLPNGKWIQNDYDYSCAPNTCEFYVYRGTIVNNKGEVFEMTTPQLKRYCDKMGLKMVPVFYYGTVEDYINENCSDFSFGNKHDGFASFSKLDWKEREDWRSELLALWQKKYNEKNCYMCKNVVPEEGVVISKEGDFFAGFKLKSFKFLKKESDDADKGEVDMETQESVTETA
jgi:hypothetical protein